MWRTLLTLGSGALRPVSSRCLAAVVLLLATAGVAVAQDGAIAGSVTAVTGETITGAQVHIPGTSFGTLTDDAGRYRLTGVPAGEHLLRVSTIGYQGSEQLVTVTADEVATVDFVLEISAVALDQIVATITGERRRRELSADISTIEATTVVENTRTNDINSLIKGQATGVYVRQSSGTVGTGSDVRIRGTGSISLSTQPLYVIDGAIIRSDNNANDQFALSPNGFGVGGQDFTRLTDLNPDEIESIEVIKGPAASALWGARGSAGVILITTKKGGVQTRWNARADLGSNEQRTTFPTSFWNPLSFGFLTDTLYTQNLLEEFDPFRNGLYQNYNMNVSGGAGIWNYFGSVQYGNEKGTLPNNQQEKFNFRANFNVDPSDKVNLSFSNGFTSSDIRLPNNDNDARGYIGVALIGFPWQHPMTAADPVTGETVQTCPFDVELSKLTGVPTTEIDSCPENSFFRQRTFDDVETILNEKKIERYTGSGNLTWNPVQRWTNRFTLGYDMLSDRTVRLIPVDPDLPFGTPSLGDIIKPFETDRSLTLQGTTAYDLDFNEDFGFEGIGGVQWFRQTIEAAVSNGQVFPAAGPAVVNAVNTQTEDFFLETKSLGFFVQGQFDWRDRVFVNGAVRWDNNSAQGENLGIQTYPKFGASVIALEGQGVFNMLKFRGAWGRSGTLPGTNDAKALVTPSQVAFQGTDQLGVSPNRPGNALLAPEVGEEWEAGVDLALWNDRIGFTFTYYDQKTENTVVTKDLAPSEGFPNEVFTNIGQIDNQGFEVALDALVLDHDKFVWDWRFLVSRNSNTISELVDPIIYGLGGNSQRHQQGLPFGSYVQPLVTIGADGEPAVLTCDKTPGTWGPGDTPGDSEDFCDPLDSSRFIGDPQPSFEGSVQTTMTLFKYVTLYALFDFQQGHQSFDSTTEFMCGFLGGGPAGGTCPDIFEADASGELTDEARIKAFAAGIQSAAPWQIDADWGKLRTVQARFDMPQSVLRFLKLSGLSFSFIGENLVTWTSYTGLDPEINFAGQNEASRAEFLTLPPARRFIASVNLFF